MSTILALFELIPLLLGLIKGVRREVKRGKTRNDIKNSMRAIDEAFKNNNPDVAGNILNTMWNGSKEQTKDGVDIHKKRGNK